MPRLRSSLKKQRTKAYKIQKGLCYYCNLPMWNTDRFDFASKFHISNKAANLFQCTGEHLLPHCKGGTSRSKNIVASCKFCNQQRHRRKVVLEPKDYYNFVQNRISKGRWNISILATGTKSK